MKETSSGLKKRTPVLLRGFESDNESDKESDEEDMDEYFGEDCISDEDE